MEWIARTSHTTAERSLSGITTNNKNRRYGASLYGKSGSFDAVCVGY